MITITITITLMLQLSAAAAPKGCTEVTRDKCGTSWYDSCLKCGTSGSYDCEQCCPGCTSVDKGGFKYCDCKPGPGPSPTPSGGDSWAHYTVASMDVTSVTGGHNPTKYDKVVVMLHGGGGSGSDWEYTYQQGWFGNLSGFKYVFPTSSLEGHVWFNTYKNGCGLNDDCAYDIPSIQGAASRVAALIEHEKSFVGNDPSKVYLAGFSEGAQLTGYMQLAHLNFPLGGTIVMDGFPLPPLFDMPGHDPAEARKNASYWGEDMAWMLYWGARDPIFPADFSLATWHAIFDVLGINSTLQVEHTEPRMTHTLTESEFRMMVGFIRGERMFG